MRLPTVLGATRYQRIIEQILRLAEQNISLRRRERTHLLFMAHVIQERVSSDQIAALLPRKKRAVFDKFVRPFLCDRSKLRRTRAWVASFHLIGIHPDTITEFMGYGRRTVRRLMNKFDSGKYTVVLRTGSKKPRKHLRPEYRDKLFSIMHAPPSQYGINRTTWTIDLLRDVLEEEGTRIGKNAISQIIACW